jgi:hypothetical protein
MQRVKQLMNKELIFENCTATVSESSYLLSSVQMDYGALAILANESNYFPLPSSIESIIFCSSTPLLSVESTPN